MRVVVRQRFYCNTLKYIIKGISPIYYSVLVHLFKETKTKGSRNIVLLIISSRLFYCCANEDEPGKLSLHYLL